MQLKCRKINHPWLAFTCASSRKNRAICEICLKLKIKSPEQRLKFDVIEVFIVNFFWYLQVIFVYSSSLTILFCIWRILAFSEPVLESIINLQSLRPVTLSKMVFSSEICEIFKNTFFEEHLRATASIVTRGASLIKFSFISFTYFIYL